MRYFTLFILFIGFSLTTNAQTDKASEQYHTIIVDEEAKSPRKEMTGAVGQTKVLVNYGSPYTKARKIWGGLVPYDRVWRAGANEATRITFSSDVTVNGSELSAGTYSYFVIPNEEDAWTVIFNKNANQWGAYKYEESDDALRIEATPQFTDEHHESLDFTLNDDALILNWEKVTLPIMIKEQVSNN